MQLDRLLERRGGAIVQEALREPQADQRLGPEVGWRRQAQADVRPVRAHVVQQEIGVGKEGLARERRGRTIARAERRDVAAGAPDPREQLPALSPFVGQGCGGGRGEKAHEGVGEVELLLIDFGVGDGIDARRDRGAADRLLGRLGRLRHAHLGDERAGVEFVEGRDECLATEPADPSVHEAVGAPPDAVVVSVGGVGVAEDHRVRHGVEEPAAEDREGGPHAASGRVLRERLRVDAECGLQGGRDLQLDHGTALAREWVACGAGVERRRVHFHFVAAAARDRLFVALPAPGGVEQGPEALLRREQAVEDDAAAAEAVLLCAAQATERVAGIDGLVALVRGDASEHEREGRSTQGRVYRRTRRHREPAEAPRHQHRGKHPRSVLGRDGRRGDARDCRALLLHCN